MSGLPIEGAVMDMAELFAKAVMAAIGAAMGLGAFGISESVTNATASVAKAAVAVFDFLTGGSF